MREAKAGNYVMIKAGYSDINSVKYLEALTGLRGRPNPYLIVLWYYAKSHADEHGVPDVTEGFFPSMYEEVFESLRELRYNLQRYVSSTALDVVRKEVKGFGIEAVYYKYTSRLERRAQGQFSTPYPLAKRMVSFSRARSSVYDIGAGTGTFLRAAYELGFTELYGIEISPILCDIARFNLVGVNAHIKIVWGDFLLQNSNPTTDLWVSNPPYTRHHQIPKSLKELYMSIVKRWFPRISAFSSLYVYFFVKIIEERDKWHWASFICPRSLYDSVHSAELKKWLVGKGVVHALEVFHNQRVFKEAETGPVITYMSKDAGNIIYFRNYLLEKDDVKVLGEVSKHLDELNPVLPWTNIAIKDIRMDEGVALGELFRVMRGVATGANDYFVVNEETVRRYGLPPTVLIPVIARTRYCMKDVFAREDWERLRFEGREVYLLDLSRDENNPSVQEYIELGKRLGIPSRSLVKTRRKWYEMEKREPPPIFVTYLSRGRPRFILNEARVVPLNVFLCLYPRKPLTNDAIATTWRYLNSEDVLGQFEYLARNYGEDTLKVEPRILERLKIPPYVLSAELHGIFKYINN